MSLDNRQVFCSHIRLSVMIRMSSVWPFMRTLPMLTPFVVIFLLTDDTVNGSLRKPFADCLTKP